MNFGALVSSVAICRQRVSPYRLAIGISPGLSELALPRIVWCGAWGFLFMLPIVRGRWWLCGIVLTFAPSAFQSLYVFHREAGQGFFGFRLGALTLFAVAANAIWGRSAAWLLGVTGRA